MVPNKVHELEKWDPKDDYHKAFKNKGNETFIFT